MNTPSLTREMQVLGAGLVALLLTLIAPSNLTLAQSPPPEGKKVALLVGVNKYDKRLFNDLSFAERDVEEMAAVLEKGGYEVHLLTGSASGAKRATLKNIQAAIETVLQERTKRDLVLVGLAGHGLQMEVTNDAGKLQAESFYCPVDAESGNSKSMLGMGHLFEEINHRGGGRNLVLVDACREDPTRGRGMDGSTVKTLPEGVAVLFGCAAGQKTYETEKAGGGHGVFFHTVLEGLRGGAKKNDAGEVTWSSVVDYVTENVETDLERFVGKTPLPQTPNLVTNLRGRSPVILPRVETDFAGTKDGQERSDNALKMRFCWCPPGKFTMGSSKDEKDRSDDEDQVSVTISRGFWLGKYEVRQDEWERIMEKNPSWFCVGGGGKATVAGVDTSRFPVETISWIEATEFCRRLTDQERRAGRLPATSEYRLPTEAQWHYACRASTSTATAFGDRLSSRQANFDGSRPYSGADSGPYLNRTEAVGSYRGNAWGLCDMHGNVAEWCRDWYRKELPGGTNPEVTERLTFRAKAGGSWRSAGKDCRSATRSRNEPDFRNNGVGFRAALVLVQSR